ncbi:MAG: chain-length determining protein [Sphingomonadaceae bacterium]|nr:chain-length determining protein [Sphingomonadaceae bacterium]
MNAVWEEARIALHVIWQRRWIALAAAWAIALIGWLAISLVPNRYESSAKIFVQSGSVLSDKVGITPNDQRADIDRVQGTLLSADNLAQVVRGTDLARQATNPADMNAQIVRLQKAVTVKQLGDNLFTITADMSAGGFSDGQNAKLARAVVQKLIDQFVSENVAGSRNDNENSLHFLDAQLAQRQQQLATAEQKQIDFEQRFMGLLPGTGSIEERMSTARSQLDDIESNLAAAQSSLAAVSSEMGSTPATIAAPSLGGGGGGLSDLQGQLAGLKARGLTDMHPDVVALKTQIAAMQAAGAGGASAGGTQPNPLYVSLRGMAAEKQATVSALSARRAQISSEIAQFQAKQAAQPEVASQAAQLARDHDVLKAAYDKLLQDREDVKLRADAEAQGSGVQFRVIDPPSAPRVPVAPNRPLLLTGVLLLAVAGGAGAAYAHAKLQSSYSTVDQLALASGLQVVGAVTAVLAPRQKAERGEKLKWFAGGGAALGGAYALLLVVELVRRAMTA